MVTTPTAGPVTLTPRSSDRGRKAHGVRFRTQRSTTWHHNRFCVSIAPGVCQSSGSASKAQVRGSQLVRVEHVHVHEGAQAIIGNVTPGNKKLAAMKAHRERLDIAGSGTVLLAALRTCSRRGSNSDDYYLSCFNRHFVFPDGDGLFIFSISP